jgi:hypothetical protein
MTATKSRPIDWHVFTTVVDDQPHLTGLFRLSVNSMDYNTDDIYEFKDYFSEQPVRVTNGCVSTVDLIDGCNSLHSQTGYWGKYIEELEYRADTNTIEVHFGS